MTNLEFFEIVKIHMKDYFVSNGYTSCKIYKGKRNSICFEKKVEFYTVQIAFQWQTLSNNERQYFSILSISKILLFDVNKPRWEVWSFKTEEELLELLKIIPNRIEEQDFFKIVDDYNYWYFHRNNVT